MRWCVGVDFVWKWRIGVIFIFESVCLGSRRWWLSNESVSDVLIVLLDGNCDSTSKKVELTARSKNKNCVNSTWFSQVVTHPSTDQALRCLTSVIGREPVLSSRCGRWHETYTWYCSLKESDVQLISISSRLWKRIWLSFIFLHNCVVRSVGECKKECFCANKSIFTAF